MHIKQNLSILFFLKKQKTNKRGKAPIYIRVTIDGLRDEFSSGIQINPGDWDVDNKTVFPSAPGFKKVCKKLNQIQVDLERHFDLAQAKNTIATPQMVIESYQTPINGHDLQKQKIENLQLSEEIDKITWSYIDLCNRKVQAKERAQLTAEKQELFEIERLQIKEKLIVLVKKAQKVFDDKTRVKTLMLATDELILHLLQLNIAGERSEATLEKWMGRKKRFFQFLNYRFKAGDIALDKLEFKFLPELKNYVMVHHNCIENTATRYCQNLKEIINRAVVNQWMPLNIFKGFTCSYSIPQMNWLTLEQMDYFSSFEFSKEKYNVYRDIYVAMSFLGYAYADIHAAEPEDLFIGIDGEEWITRNRKKTDEEECLPLLPIVKKIFEKYKDHPICTRKNRLLPVPTNQEFNRCLKEMGKEISFKILTEKKKGTHLCRYFMVNEVLYNNDVPLKTAGKIAGQGALKTTERYVRPNKKQISQNMARVKEKLFDEEGNLVTSEKPKKAASTSGGGKVIQLKIS